MKRYIPYAITIIIILIATYTTDYLVSRITSVEYTGFQNEEPTLSHAQDTWMRALEWCESNGIPDAVNPEDLDMTPSYGSWQFKPSTLDYFAEKYGIATTTVMDRNVQEKVLTQMILHRDEINWHQQFPWCVKKLGIPPYK